MLLNFKTIYKPAEIEFFEKGSRFIGYAYPMECATAAMEQISKICKMHAKAHHNCYAFRIGANNEFTKQSDDGEPAGTAGMPILDFLQKSDIKNTLIVVTRYFGGTLLGKGGLVRAYGAAAKQACHAAHIIEKIANQKFNIKVPYHLSGKMEHEIRGTPHFLKEIAYEENVNFEVYIETNQTESFIKLINNTTAATAEIFQGEAVYLAEVKGKKIIF